MTSRLLQGCLLALLVARLVPDAIPGGRSPAFGEDAREVAAQKEQQASDQVGHGDPRVFCRKASYCERKSSRTSK